MPTTNDKSLMELGHDEIERLAKAQADADAREKHVEVEAGPEWIEVEAGIETERATWSAWCRYYWEKTKGWFVGGRVEW